MNNVFLEALTSHGPHPSLGVHAETYGRVIGSWSGEVRNHMIDGPASSGTIEVHFGWVLQGLAVQDVWITPARKDRKSTKAASLDWYGTTVRRFDPKTESWRASWLDPVSGYQIDLEGRRQGNDIVQIGTRGGWPIRWIFTDIHRDSFSWRGEILNPDGQTWRLEVAILLRRDERPRS